jgi:hypothetical protein
MNYELMGESAVKELSDYQHEGEINRDNNKVQCRKEKSVRRQAPNATTKKSVSKAIIPNLQNAEFPAVKIGILLCFPFFASLIIVKLKGSLVLCIEHNDGIERFTRLACKAFDKRSLPFFQQGGELCIA